MRAVKHSARLDTTTLRIAICGITGWMAAAVAASGGVDQPQLSSLSSAMGRGSETGIWACKSAVEQPWTKNGVLVKTLGLGSMGTLKVRV